MEYVKKIEAEISSWPNTSTRTHRIGGRAFLFGKAEVGKVHTGGVVDIAFPRPIHDVLLAEGLAQEHHWVPNSGWITFQVHSEADFKYALWLLRLSLLCYLLKTAVEPRELFEQESERLHLSPRFKLLLESFLPKRTKPVSADPLAA